MPDFDAQKWSFVLVAVVIGWILLMCFEFVTMCLWLHWGQCETGGKFIELLNTVLASALAFAAGRITQK